MIRVLKTGSFWPRKSLDSSRIDDPARQRLLKACAESNILLRQLFGQLIAGCLVTVARNHSFVTIRSIGMRVELVSSHQETNSMRW